MGSEQAANASLHPCAGMSSALNTPPFPAPPPTRRRQVAVHVVEEEVGAVGHRDARQDAGVPAHAAASNKAPWGGHGGGLSGGAVWCYEAALRITKVPAPSTANHSTSAHLGSISLSPGVGLGKVSLASYLLTPAALGDTPLQ